MCALCFQAERDLFHGAIGTQGRPATMTPGEDRELIPALNVGPGKDRLALAILAGFAVTRLLFAFTIDLGVDESYTVAISRSLSLSYFDHPPLHLWLVHFAARALGENVAARVPFIGLFFVTGWIYYRLASGLFGARAALVALFALNVTPFFFASTGSWIVPDGPLLLGLVIAAWAAAHVFFRRLAG